MSRSTDIGICIIRPRYDSEQPVSRILHTFRLSFVFPPFIFFGCMKKNFSVTCLSPPLCKFTAFLTKNQHFLLNFFYLPQKYEHLFVFFVKRLYHLKNLLSSVRRRFFVCRKKFFIATFFAFRLFYGYRIFSGRQGKKILLIYFKITISMQFFLVFIPTIKSIFGYP